jgi:bacteriocin-like protein
MDAHKAVDCEPQQLSDTELDTVSGGTGALLATTLSNSANLRHDMQKTVANNLRA